jgi:hypothetical protein
MLPPVRPRLLPVTSHIFAVHFAPRPVRDPLGPTHRRAAATAARAVDELYSSLKGVHLSKAAGREKVRCLSRRLRSQQGGYVHMDDAYVLVLCCCWVVALRLLVRCAVAWGMPVEGGQKHPSLNSVLTDNDCQAAACTVSDV